MRSVYIRNTFPGRCSLPEHCYERGKNLFVSMNSRSQYLWRSYFWIISFPRLRCRTLAFSAFKCFTSTRQTCDVPWNQQYRSFALLRAFGTFINLSHVFGIRHTYARIYFTHTHTSVKACSVRNLIKLSK